MKNNALITIGFLIISNIIACQTENIKPHNTMSDKKYNSLTKEEERVILYKGTRLVDSCFLLPGINEIIGFPNSNPWVSCSIT